MNEQAEVDKVQVQVNELLAGYAEYWGWKPVEIGVVRALMSAAEHLGEIKGKITMIKRLKS